MLGRRPVPFPVDAVRDLLGVVRAIEAAATTPRGRARAAAVAHELEVALVLAESGPDTVGERAAWARAEDACLAAGDLVGLTDDALSIVEAGCRRVRGR